jgi:hypothetical protein
MLYRVNMDVHDDTFLLAARKIVDSWSEPRLSVAESVLLSARRGKPPVGASNASVRHAGAPLRVPGPL